MYYFNIHYNKKYKCLECKKVLCKKDLEHKSLYSNHHYLHDYIFAGGMLRGSISDRVAFHWKDEEYYHSGGVSCQENICGEMVILDDNGKPVKCFMCDSDVAPYETKLGQACNKCIFKALDKENETEDKNIRTKLSRKNSD